MKFLSIILFIGFSIFTWKSGDACKCAVLHPQQKYCSSDYAILATPVLTELNDFERIYRVENITILKMNDNALSLMENYSMLLHTGTSSASCGVKFNIGYEYLISGSVFESKAHIGLCSISALWEDVSEYHRNAYSSLFNKECSCKIKNCYGDSCSKDDDECIQDNTRTSHCYSEFSVCTRVDGKCQFKGSSELEKCLEM